MAALCAFALLGPLAAFRSALFFIAIFLAGIAAAGYLLWRVHPAWTLSGALVLSVLAGNWEQLGIPGALAPDRWMFVGGIAAVLIRAPPVRDRPPLHVGAVHWAMVLALLWTVGSALDAGTLSDQGDVFRILERYGVIPFLLFLVAPTVFATERHRRILLGALVGLGGYLGYTALMETLNLDPLVIPPFITDASIGTHTDRARGPFLEAVTNGAGLYVGGVGAAIALALWRGERARATAAVVLAACLAGLLFTETRSVWIAGALASVLALLSARELRRWSLPALGAGVAVLALSVALVPGLAQAIEERQEDERTVWDRKNLATAAVNMVGDEPLVGIGWGRFTEEGDPYFRLSQDFPQTATDTIIHHQFLTYAAETGLIGFGLWATALGLAMIAALRPGRPEARPWQIGVGAYLIFFIVVCNFVYPQVFPNSAMWLLAGVAVGAAGRATGPARVPTPRSGDSSSDLDRPSRVATSAG